MDVFEIPFPAAGLTVHHAVAAVVAGRLEERIDHRSVADVIQVIDGLLEHGAHAVLTGAGRGKHALDANEKLRRPNGVGVEGLLATRASRGVGLEQGE